MDLITLTKDNLETEHICCAISNNRDCQVASKKAWLGDRLDDGLVFTKANARGKCFIEYLPAEKAWAPICAPGFMYIDCLWVSGQFKGHGYANQLLDDCILKSRADGKLGLVALSSSPKKLPFLSDPGYLAHRGFRIADTAEPNYALYYLPFTDGADQPHFCPSVKKPLENADGFVLYYSAQCPYTAKYVPLIASAAEERSLPFRSVRFASAAEAQSAPSPFTAYSLFYNGQLVTHEILSVPKFIKLADSLCVSC